MKVKISSSLRRSIISKILIPTVLLGNVSTTSKAGVLSEDTRYETFENGDMTIDDVRESVYTEVEVSGETLVNNFNYSYMSNVSSVKDAGGFSLSGREFTRDYTGIIDESFWTSTNQEVLKEGGKYTIIVDVIENNVSEFVEVFPFTWQYGENMKGSVYVDPGYTGKKMISIDCKKTSPFYLFFKNLDRPINGSITISNIMILEGDYYNDLESGKMKFPEYFEEMKSSGERESGSPHINVKSKNKNLMDLNIYKNARVEHGGVLEVTEETIKITTPRTTSDFVDSYMDIGVDGAQNIVKNYYSQYLIPVKSNTEYTFSYKVESSSKNNHDLYLDFRDINCKQLRIVCYEKENNENAYTFTTPVGTEYIMVRFDNNYGGNSLLFKDIQLEEGTSRTSYEKYTEDVKTVNLTSPLRGLPNGVKDRVIKKNGQWYIERNVGEISFNGSEDWRIHILAPVAQETFVVYLSGNSNYVDMSQDRHNTGYIMSNRVPMLSANAFDIVDSDSIAVGSTDMYNYMIRVNRNKLESQDLTGFKKWLSQNPIKVVYKLESPTYEPINYGPHTLFESYTYITEDSIVSPVMKTTVDRAINRAIDYSEIALTTNKLSDISKARYWTNLLNESVKKDSLQSSLNSITDISDLGEMDRKNVSANSDIYIKTKNVLVMSLSTNSIVFDDVDGTENTEFKNALEISMQSTLPYELKASLETDIANSDGTVIIPANSLSVKESTDATYKPFLALKDEILLRDVSQDYSENTHKIDFKLAGVLGKKADVYRTVVRFEATQK